MSVSRMRKFVSMFISLTVNGFVDEDADDWKEHTRDKFAPRIEDALSRIGVTDVQQILGAGSFGVAAQIDDARVLKLTTDKTEIQAAAVLVGKSLDNVARVYSSFTLKGIAATLPAWWDPDSGEVLDVPIGAIVMQRVDTGGIDPKEKSSLNKIVNTFKADQGLTAEEIWKMSPALRRAKLHQASIDLEAEIYDKVRSRLGTQVAAGLRQLRGEGVFAIDVHGANVGELDDEYKLFDIGMSSSPARPRPRSVAAEMRETGAVHFVASECVRANDSGKLSHMKPIVIEQEGPHAYKMYVHGNPVVDVSKSGGQLALSFAGRPDYRADAPVHVFGTKKDADGVAHLIGRYMLKLGDHVYSYVEHRSRGPKIEAEEDRVLLTWHRERVRGRESYYAISPYASGDTDVTYHLTHHDGNADPWTLMLSAEGGRERSLGRFASMDVAKAEAERHERAHHVRHASEDCDHSHPASVPVRPCAHETVPVVYESSRIGRYNPGDYTGLDPAYSVDLTYRGTKDASLEKKIEKAVGRAPSFVERYTTVKKDRVHVFLFDFDNHAQAQVAARAIRGMVPKGSNVAVVPTGLTKKETKLRGSTVEKDDKGRVAREHAPVIHEPRAGFGEVSGYATNDQDPAEVAAGKALGPVRSTEDVYRVLHEQFAKESQEVFVVLPMNLHGELLSRPVEVARGQRDRVAVDESDILRPVIRTNAKLFIVAHVHPSGHATPSQADRDLTDTIEKASQSSLKNVLFADHVVIGAGEFYSIKEDRMYKA